MYFTPTSLPATPRITYELSSLSAALSDDPSLFLDIPLSGMSIFG